MVDGIELSLEGTDEVLVSSDGGLPSGGLLVKVRLSIFLVFLGSVPQFLLMGDVSQDDLELTIVSIESFISQVDSVVRDLEELLEGRNLGDIFRIGGKA